jgi:hypothetical protein
MALDEEDACCRYCLDSSGGILISPCLCKGTQAFIHVECQKRGYAVNMNAVCPVCKDRFRNIIEEPFEDIQPWAENSFKNLVYCLPAFNTGICMYSFVGFAQFFQISWIPYEAQFALFQISWQACLLLWFYSYVILFKVKNKRRYIYLTFFQSPCSYAHLHLCIMIYIICGFSMSKNTVYQMVGLLSQCFTHVHVFRHVDVMTRMNTMRRVEFIV